MGACESIICQQSPQLPLEQQKSQILKNSDRIVFPGFQKEKAVSVIIQVDDSVMLQQNPQVQSLEQSFESDQYQSSSIRDKIIDMEINDADGSRYKGQMLNKQKHGFGHYKWNDGSYYIGHWESDGRCGKGLFITQSGEEIYQGMWVNDKLHGKGLKGIVNKYFYQGEWVHGIQHGSGFEMQVFTDQNGQKTMEKYIGDYKNGLKSGTGTKIFRDGSFYIGEFSNDCQDGYGSYFWSTNGGSYKGEWRANQFNGLGRLEMEDGQVYDGSFQNDLYNGEGSWKKQDNTKILGTWVAGKIVGVGIYKPFNQPYRYAEWRDGEMIRWVQYTEEDVIKTLQFQGDIERALTNLEQLQQESSSIKSYEPCHSCQSKVSLQNPKLYMFSKMDEIEGCFKCLEMLHIQKYIKSKKESYIRQLY